MQQSREPVENSGMEGVRRHDHLCLLYESEAEILAPVIPFIQKGVALGERCIYLNAGEEMLERVLNNAVSAQNKDIGALMLLPAREAWLQGGSFDAARVMALLQSLCSSAAEDGFKGTRLICDMGWAGRAALGEGLLIEFELGLNLFAARNEVTLLCLYHRGTFPAELMLELARLHPHLVTAGNVCRNPFFIPPDRDPAVPRAACELDLFLAAVQATAGAATDRERLRQELEQAYAALARKIYENWQEEDTLRASEKELHEKDEALLGQRRRIQTILQHLPAMLMAFDMENRLAACNHEFERVTGFRAEEVMGKSILELIEVEGEGCDEVVAAHPPEGGDYRGRMERQVQGRSPEERFLVQLLPLCHDTRLAQLDHGARRDAEGQCRTRPQVSKRRAERANRRAGGFRKRRFLRPERPAHQDKRPLRHHAGALRGGSFALVPRDAAGDS
jgi:PAS domain S-box-containing protein